MAHFGRVSRIPVGNFLIDQSSAIETQLPFQARWIIDTMAIKRSVKSKKTYKE